VPEHACGARIRELTTKLNGIEARRDELAIDNDLPPEPLQEDDLRDLAAHVRQ
jgi:hypothetical protein